MRLAGTLEITTAIGCPMKCRYCPQPMLLNRYRETARASQLSLVDFARFIETVPRETAIHFSGMCEPWLHPQATSMLLHAVGRHHPVSVYTTLVGMSREDFERLRDVDYVRFAVHLADTEGHSHIPVTAQYLELLRKVLATRLRTQYPKEFSCHGTLHPLVAPLMDPSIPVSSTMIDRAGNLAEGERRAVPLRGPIVCGRAGRELNRNVLLPDGTVLLCCMDYGMQHVLGNLGQDTYQEILDGAAMRRVRLAVDDDSLPLLCRRCTVAVKATT
jgi:hypothetical protein